MYAQSLERLDHVPLFFVKKLKALNPGDMQTEAQPSSTIVAALQDPGSPPASPAQQQLVSAAAAGF